MKCSLALAAIALAAFSYAGAQPANVDVIEGRQAVHAPNLPASDYYLARNTLVEIELTDTIDTASARSGQVFHYTVTRDIAGDGGVVIPRGAAGTGRILEARKGAKHATPRLHLGFGEVPSVESRPVKLGFLAPALRANENLGNGLTAVIGGYFESSARQIRLPAGLRIVTNVEFPYGTRRIKAGEGGASYHLFSDQPVGH